MVTQEEEDSQDAEIPTTILKVQIAAVETAVALEVDITSTSEAALKRMVKTKAQMTFTPSPKKGLTIAVVQTQEVAVEAAEEEATSLIGSKHANMILMSKISAPTPKLSS